MPVVNYATIKQSTLDSLTRYVEQHIPTGDFLRAVLENDLMEACGRADEENAIALFQICAYVYNELPTPSHGSPEKVKKWLYGRKA
jgi:hypothetical protein